MKHEVEKAKIKRKNGGRIKLFSYLKTETVHGAEKEGPPQVPKSNHRVTFIITGTYVVFIYPV